MTTDPDDDVRDWACFGLGQLEADNPTVRDALAARLDDPHEDTRCEALVALAETGDPRALTAVSTRLTGDLTEVCSLDFRAAAELADPALLATLGAVAEDWSDDDEHFTRELDFAVKRCAVDSAQLAATVEKQLADELRSRLDARLSVVVEASWPRTTMRFLDGVSSVQVWSDRLWDEVAHPSDLDVGQTVATYLHTVHTRLPGADG